MGFIRKTLCLGTGGIVNPNSRKQRTALKTLAAAQGKSPAEVDRAGTRREFIVGKQPDRTGRDKLSLTTPEGAPVITISDAISVLPAVNRMSLDELRDLVGTCSYWRNGASRTPGERVVLGHAKRRMMDVAPGVQQGSTAQDGAAADDYWRHAPESRARKLSSGDDTSLSPDQAQALLARSPRLREALHERHGGDTYLPDGTRADGGLAMSAWVTVLGLLFGIPILAGLGRVLVRGEPAQDRCPACRLDQTRTGTLLGLA